MATGIAAVPKTEFENVSEGVLGVVVVDPDTGKAHGIAVKPGDSVWLSEQEEILTANAPKLDEHNPFTAGWLKLKTRATEMKSRRPIGSSDVTPVTFDPSTEIPDQPPVEEEPLDQGNKPVPVPREERPPDADTTGAPPPLPEGDPQRGARSPEEEVGTPQAVAKAGRAKPAGRGQTVTSGPTIEKAPPEPGRPQAAVMTPAGVQHRDASDR